ncbi:MAG: cyclic nucleotide-binding domain-containing protein [Pseudobdellovibrio sp.]
MPEFVKVNKDMYLFEEGDAPDAMYIVKSGQISLFISDGTNQKVVATATPGQLIGEMALFDKKPRSATAKAIVASEVVKLPYAQLDKDLSKMPEWVQSILKKKRSKYEIFIRKIVLNVELRPEAKNV